MMHAKVGAGALLVLFCLGSGAMSSPQDTKAGAQSTATKPASSATVDGGVKGIGGYNTQRQSPVGEDGEFLRRVMLDLVGYPPNLDQVKAFMAATETNKRPAKIEELLASEDFADYWSRLFAEVYFGNYHEVAMDTNPKLSKASSARIIDDFLKWFRLKLNKDAPYTEIVAQMLDARGTDAGDPALGYKLSFYRTGESMPSEFANDMARHLLGIRMVCAKCHDHPFDKWTTDHYYDLASFIIRQKARPSGSGAEKDSSDHVEIKYAEEGEMQKPNEEKGGKKAVNVKLSEGGMAKPIWLFGGEAGKNDDRMKVLANLVTSKADPQLPRALANRVWGWLFGRGIVHPVDDFSMRNKPASPALLEGLVRDLVENKYSLKHLIRVITNSDAYQRASANDAKYEKIDYSCGTVKQLNGEQLMNSVYVACTGTPKKDVGHTLQMVASLYPAGAVWCETTPLPGNARQALLLRNNSEIMGIINGGIMSKIKSAAGSTQDKVNEMFLAALSRKATEGEKARYAKFIDGHSGSGWEDAYWTLLNTTEFVTRH